MRTPRSEQAKHLSRSLSLRLALYWVIYTIAFVIIALILNATLVPRVAYMVADSTADWHYWDKREYPLEVCLTILDGHVVGTAETDADERELDATSQEVEVATMLMREEGMSSEAVWKEIAIDPSELEQGDVSEESPILVSIHGQTPIWTNLDKLRYEAILQVAQSISPTEGWQILDAGTVIEGRDLSLYWSLRDLKYPIAIAVYLIGCILIVFLGYSKFSRYFDELTTAVAGVLRDREKPIKLSKGMMVVQGELNDIRLASLADERAAKAAEQRKDELVAYLAHDIKTPLTSVIGYLMLLDEAPELPEDIRKKYIHTACTKSERLESLIDEFFEITRYNLHAIPIERQTVDISTLCLQVADEFYPTCQEKNLEVKVDAPEGQMVFVDPGKFARVLGNIMRNAVAYADRGTEILVKAEADAQHGCKISVTDHGREISPAHLESIFERFYREDGARSSESGGSGLGLAIAKEIMEAHRGSITAESTDGVTTFTIYVP